jgi:hypothetical protein
MKQLTPYSLVLCSLLVSGCAGKVPKPISQYHAGDANLTCHQIRLLISDNQRKIEEMIPKQHKKLKNTALGAAGLVIWPAWLFMDFSKAEQIEIRALQQRNNWLYTLAAEKQCGAMPLETRFQEQ